MGATLDSVLRGSCLIALLLLACGAGQPGATDADAALVARTIAAWNARADLGHVPATAMIVRDERTPGQYCGGAAGCATFHYPVPMGRGVPVISVAHGLHGGVRESVIVHETLHHCFVLAGMGHDDRFHRDRRVWCDYSQGGCRPGSVEYSARFENGGN